MSQDHALHATLEKAGISADMLRDMEVLSSSAADEAGNDRVHLATNDKIEEVLAENNLGVCIHVTGGARALMDPNHRSVCTAIVGRGNEPFTILYNVPADKRNDPNQIVGWNLGKWEQKGFKNWRERLQVIDLVGFGAVDLKAYDAEHEIQFSVFGNQYIQIQGEHTEGAKTKPVWLIKSEKINLALTEQALSASEKSTDINETLFREFSLDLHSLLSRYILIKILKTPGLDRDGLFGDPNLEDAIGSPEKALDGLCLMNFVKTTGANGLAITDFGHDFIKLLTSDNER